MDHKDIFDPQLIDQIEQLRETESRDLHAAAATRMAFLTEARNASQSVSNQPLHRLNEWMAVIITFLTAPRKTKGVSMLSTVLSLLVVLGLAFGGGTVAAAQNSMPDDALYQVKLMSEDARLSIAADQEMQLQLALEFAERRMEEVQTMLQAGEVPSEPVMFRLQNQLAHAMNLAANMPDEQYQTELLKLQTRLQQREQVMLQLELNQDTDPALLQIRERIQTMLQLQLQLCNDGMEDPALLREQSQLQLQNGEPYQYEYQYQFQYQQGDMDQSEDGASNQNQIQNQNQNGANDETPAIGPNDPPAPGNDGVPGGNGDGSGQTDSGGNGNHP